MNTRSPASRDDEGSDEATLYLSAKLFTPDTLVATVLTLAIAPPTVLMLAIAPATVPISEASAATALMFVALPATEEMFELFPNARTFPQIKIDEKSIGGYDQLVEYFVDIKPV